MKQSSSTSQKKPASIRNMSKLVCRILLLPTVALVMLLGGCAPDKVQITNAGNGGTTAASCTGFYSGEYSMPDHATRIAMRNRSLAGRGIAITGNDDIDNANAGGGSPDGGIWMTGSYEFETDASCNVVYGYTLVFNEYLYLIDGSVNKDGTFSLTWSGQGSTGEMFGKVDASNNISGEFHHPAPDSYVHGVLSGTFLPRK